MAIIYTFSKQRAVPAVTTTKLDRIGQASNLHFYLCLEITDLLSDLFSKAGFDVVVNEYVHRQTVNKKEGISVPRVFVQSKFSKKTEDAS